MALNDDLKAEAADLGFILSGISPPTPPATFPHFKRWIEAGKHAGMVYLATERSLRLRSNPQVIYPDCHSIVVVGLQYPPPEKMNVAPQKDGSGQIASYACGLDYHLIIPQQLNILSIWLQEKLNLPIKQYNYTDSGPILERDIAQQAGLGWVGKNTCVISPTHGSFFLLGELLINAELAPTSPFYADRCGKCHLCLDTCPTQCILPDRTIDSSRCISYLTIENKGGIPIGMRKLTSNWVFGCDLCQIACPWNHKNTNLHEKSAFKFRPDLIYPALRREMLLSPSEFNRKFKDTPILRARRRGYLRNVAIALGNQQNPDDVPVLSQVLAEEPESLVRGHAAWALSQIPTKSARIALDRCRKIEMDEGVREEIENALAQKDS